MYLEEVEEANAIDDKDRAASSVVCQRRTVDHELSRKIARSVNDRHPISLEGMEKPRKNFEESEVTRSMEKKINSNVELVDSAGGGSESSEEKCRQDEEVTHKNLRNGRADGGKSEDDCEGDEGGDNDDSFGEGDEPEETALFSNKMQSIFIRRSTVDCEGEDSARRPKELCLQRPDKWIGKKKDKRTKKLKKKRALSFVDTLITLFIVAPLVIGQWRGIWGMMDIYKDYFPGWLCFILGSSLHVVFAISRNQLHGRFVERWRTYSKLGRVAYDFVRLVYIYVFCVACNAQWRGGWVIFSEYFGSNTVVTCIFTTLFSVALMILRSIRNLLAPPFVVVIDKPDRVFHFPTRYNVNTRDWSLYILDCAFSVGVVGSLVVFVWRGVWVLFDIHLFPENEEYSAIGSLVIGYVIVAVTFCLQPLMRYTCARLDGLARLLAADAFLLLSFLGTVNVWRGIWTVLDLWLLPEDPEMSCWITHVGCFVFLVLLNCSNSILVRGVYIDAEEEEGRCVVFPCHYLRLFFKIERQKKEARRQNLVAASKEAQSHNEGNTKEAENETLLNCANTMPTIIPANPESLV